MRKINYDIRTVGNSIGGRQGWAYVCNSGEYAVLKADMDKPQEYDDYKTFGGVRATWNYNGRKHYSDCTLVCDGGNWKLNSYGCCISASFSLYDAIELINNANTPIVDKDDIVAVAEYSKESAVLRLYKVGRIDIHCSTVAKLIPLTDDEMNEVVNNAYRWLK